MKPLYYVLSTGNTRQRNKVKRYWRSVVLSGGSWVKRSSLQWDKCSDRVRQDGKARSMPGEQDTEPYRTSRSGAEGVRRGGSTSLGEHVCSSVWGSHTYSNLQAATAIGKVEWSPTEKNLTRYDWKEREVQATEGLQSTLLSLSSLS